MATYGWGSGTSVAEGLSEEGYKFEFFEAVRLLERMYPDRTPVGKGMAPGDEAVRFRTDPDQTFAPSDVVDVGLPENGEPASVTVSFMSLTGTDGPLPEPYTEVLRERVQRGDTAMRDFFNMLTHRFIGLLYRSRKRHHVGMESSSPENSTVARYLRSAAGVGLPAHRERTSVSDRALLRYASLLSQKPSSVHGLQVLLGDYFDVGVSAEPLVGRWLDLDTDQQTTIGALGQSQTLGESAVLGRRAWDQEGRVQIELSPERCSDYLRFLPGRRGHRRLVDLSELYLARGTDFGLQLRVPGGEVPRAPLSTLVGPRLGRSAPLGSPREPKITPIEPRTFSPELETLRIPLFSALGPDQLQAVIDDLPRLEIGEETHVVRQGRPAEALYVLARGAAEVVYQSPESDETTVLASLEPGEVFAEEATLRGRRYRGSLVTTAKSTLLKITEERLDTLLEQYPSVERALETAYRDFGDGGGEEAGEAPLARRLAKTREEGFRALSAAQWRAVLRSGEVRRAGPGTVLARLGEEQGALLVLVDGAVVNPLRGARSSRPGELLNGRALLAPEGDEGTVEADGETHVLVLGRKPLQRLIQKYTFFEDALRQYLHAAANA